ncbi:hypothetical protein K0M31_000623 [Melipona bicolor]|uniref:Uncharacterized protein n=1 Tax=Melipona bicolor TaxID=60889 RepID=A0AA40KWU9_9HYME|nr:hypothetical protein K0M31_000623 [Melipona bicolor]
MGTTVSRLRRIRGFNSKLLLNGSLQREALRRDFCVDDHLNAAKWRVERRGLGRRSIRAINAMDRSLGGKNLCLVLRARARWNRKGIGPDVVLIDDHPPFHGS